MDFFKTLHINWVDFLVLLIVCVGVIRGRKRGMSEELLDVMKWLLIVVVAGYIYQPIGELVANMSVFSALFCYVSAYLLTVVGFIAFFAFLKPSLGDKLVGSDVFGASEYYLGMAAGALRYTCIIFVLLALLNARYYSPEEIAQENAYQEANFGSIRFPTLTTLHAAVLDNSMTGMLAREYASAFLIRSTAPEEKPMGQHNIVRTRERTINDILEKR
jgi:uncharacterized membrane protein required for colicin V production